MATRPSDQDKWPWDLDKHVIDPTGEKDDNSEVIRCGNGIVPLEKLLRKKWTKISGEVEDDIDVLAFRLNRSLFERFFRDRKNGNHDPEFAQCLTQLVRCYGMLHRAVTHTTTGGLTVFVQHFGRQGVLRTAAKIDQDQRYSLVTYALRYLACNDALHKVELRTTIEAKRPKSKDIAVECTGYLERYQEYLRKNNDHHSIVVFPLTLTRRQDKQSRDNDSGLAQATDLCRFQFGTIWETVGAIADLAVISPTFFKFFGVLDVAGDENELANWIFFQAHKEMRLRLGLSDTDLPSHGSGQGYTFHAGESFATPLHGLRRMGEVLDFMPWVRRIGHGLALGCDTWYSMGETWQDLEKTQELLDDLVWAWRRLKRGPGTLNAQDLAKVKSLIADLGRQLYPSLICKRVDGKLIRVLDDDELVAILDRSYELRFDRKTLFEIGLIGDPRDHIRDADNPNNGIGTYNDPSRFRGEVNKSTDRDPVERQILHKYLTDTNIDQAYRRFTDDHIRLIQTVYNELQGRIRNLCRRKGILIEVCPTSNLAIAEIPNYKSHPIFSFACDDQLPQDGQSLKKSLMVTLNTDDPGLFHVTIADEYAAVWEASAENGFNDESARQTWSERLRCRGVRHVAPHLPRSRDHLMKLVDQCLDDLRHAKAVL